MYISLVTIFPFASCQYVHCHANSSVKTAARSSTPRALPGVRYRYSANGQAYRVTARHASVYKAPSTANVRRTTFAGHFHRGRCDPTKMAAQFCGHALLLASLLALSAGSNVFGNQQNASGRRPPDFSEVRRPVCF